MDMKKVKKRMLIAAGLIGLPVITWALLAWEPFNRLLARFFPEMFYDNLGRFVPYTPVDAMAAMIVLTVYAAVPLAVILLVYGGVRSVRRRGAAGTVEKGVETTAVGIVYVLSGLWAAVLGIAGWAAREMAAAAAEEERQREEENGLFGDSAMEWDEFDWDNRRMPNHSPAIIPDKGLFHDY
ncbi:MAG: hypothetical protein IDH49_08635 [Gammaproteobacteria bacterium]|nr:hypothetical protein [Gammaproteobacteria bacterium]